LRPGKIEITSAGVNRHPGTASGAIAREVSIQRVIVKQSNCDISVCHNARKESMNFK
jgi:hypothetical protein